MFRSPFLFPANNKERNIIRFDVVGCQLEAKSKGSRTSEVSRDGGGADQKGNLVSCLPGVNVIKVVQELMEGTNNES